MLSSRGVRVKEEPAAASGDADETRATRGARQNKYDEDKTITARRYDNRARKTRQQDAEGASASIQGQHREW